MRIALAQFVGERPVLAGSEFGRQIFGRLVATLPAVGEAEPYFLDFIDSPPATASFLREAVLGLRQYLRSHAPLLYPVVANAGAETIEELQHLLEEKSDAIAACTLSSDGTVGEPRIIGALEPLQQRILNAVKEAGQATAAALASRFTNEKVGITAWNNRLAALAQKGLLIERVAGRAKNYEPVLKGL